MNNHTRAAVAYIAGRLVSGKHASCVYDYSQRRYVSIGGNVDRTHVGAFDYQRGAHVSGSGDGTSFNLYDYGDREHFLEGKWKPIFGIRLRNARPF